MVAQDKRESAQHLRDFGLSVLKACLLTGLSRASFYRRPKCWREVDAEVIGALNEVLQKSPQAGFWKCYRRIRRQGYRFNHKRVYRVYCAMGLNLPRRVKRLLPKREIIPLEVARAANQQWALDFMHDSLYCGKRFRTLNVIDEGTRECLAIEVDTSLPAERVIRVLEQLKANRGLPSQILLDNGPELISHQFADWCKAHQIKLAYIQPGKPTQNGLAERFNGSFRKEFLNAYLFETLNQVRELAWRWQIDYNEERPHDSLGGLPPAIYRKQLEMENSNFKVSH